MTGVIHLSRANSIPIRFLTLIVVLYLAACARPQTDESPLLPSSPLRTPLQSTTPNPTATFISSPTWTPWLTPTPIPILTSTPRPTSTPIPTFTSPPIPTFPPEAARPKGWPPIPEDLYFIRNGSLWRWPSKGGALEQVVPAFQSDSSGGKLSKRTLGPGLTGVIGYRLTPDGQYIVFYFVDVEPKLMVLNRTNDISVTISTAANLNYGPPSPYFPYYVPSFDITPDGRYLVYLAWGMLPNVTSNGPDRGHPEEMPPVKKAYYGTIFAVDVQNPNHEFELGYCAARSDLEYELKCDRFVLSPDGKRIAFSDGRGVWISDIPQGEPRLLAKHQHDSGFCGVWHVRNWSPDGRWLLIDVGCYEGGFSALMDASMGKVQEIPHTWNYPGPYVNITWRQNGTGMLVNHINLSSADGPAYLTLVSTEKTVQETVVISTTRPSDVWPTEAHDLPDGKIGFANQPCVDNKGLGAGVYTIEKDGTNLAFVLPLPAMPCYASEGIQRPLGMVLWSPRGEAYLYLIRDDQHGQQANLLLGLSDGSILWDVRELLADAHSFQWQPLYSGY